MGGLLLAVPLFVCLCGYGLLLLLWGGYCVFFVCYPCFLLSFSLRFLGGRGEISLLSLGRHSDISVAGGVHSILTM